MGKGKIAVLVLVAVAAVAAPMVVQQQSIQQLRQENATLKEQVAQIAPLQEQVDRAAQEATNASGGATAQMHELARLRAEVIRLRVQTNDLAKAQQAIQMLTQRIESEKANTAEARSAAAAAQQLAAVHPEFQKAHNMNACINNLRLIDAAKQQWALEQRKLATDTPVWEDLRPYLGHGPDKSLPVCPDGGVYTINSVQEKPVCNVPGHVLP